MAIKSSKDLVIGKEYFLKMWGKDDHPDKILLKDIKYPTPLFPELAKISVIDGEYEIDYFVYEIGIGESEEEAARNFKCMM